MRCGGAEITLWMLCSRQGWQGRAADRQPTVWLAAKHWCWDAHCCQPLHTHTQGHLQDQPKFDPSRRFTPFIFNCCVPIMQAAVLPKLVQVVRWCWRRAQAARPSPLPAQQLLSHLT